MSIITRYICLEIFKVFLIALAGMTIFMILIGVVQEAIRENLTPETILKLIPFILPNALCFAIPGTILFSVCLVYGRMSASNEIIGIKSMGVSPVSVMIPTLILSILLSLVTVYLNDLAVSWGRQGVYRVILHSVEKTIYAMLNAERNYQQGRLLISVSDVDGKTLVNPRVEIEQEDGQSIRCEAAGATIHVDPVEDMLVFSVTDAYMHVPGKDVKATLPQHEFPIPLRDVTKRGSMTTSPSNLPLRSMQQEAHLQRQRLTDHRRKLALDAAIQMTGGDLISLTHPQWQIELRRLGDSEGRLYRLEAEPWRRWANGFSCFCFVLVGIPLAIRLRKADFWTTFGLAFIPILLAYYPLLMLGVSKAKNGSIAPPFVWLANLSMMALGMWLIHRESRH